MPEVEFFKLHYQALRPSLTPMRWMIRMFQRLTEGKMPSLVDLLTGAGKTELIVIWLIALAWHARQRSTSQPVPRRLVWVVNRRVLVQQVYDVAEKLDEALSAPSGTTVELADLLRSVRKASGDTVFKVVQLRGQRLDDREWSLDPTMPQLIIGTVDQIGSRLLFQGYGLGKWSRPMHAGLFGVDTWVCVDEAHLVPAFAVTLRQVREMACRPIASTVPAPFVRFFQRLPFCITELSATPGLPSPKHGTAFRLEDEDESDSVIADRLLAKITRRVVWKPQPEKKFIARDLAAEALETVKARPGGPIAIFCRKVEDAKAVAKTLSNKHPGCVLLITGRVRGYERDRMSTSGGLFDRFRQGHDEGPAADTLPTFLVGTAAAEVGLDADASAIVCDFASLPTLVQRLGRLDRRGQLSKRAKQHHTDPPTMTIIGGSNGKTTHSQLDALVAQLKSASSGDSEFLTNFFSGSPWLVLGKPSENYEESTDSEETEEESGRKLDVEDAITASTWKVLALPAANPDTHEARQPAAWLTDPLAAVTSGPVVVPPLTESVLRRWAATTPRPSRFLPVHPWLYGQLPDDEGTPLVGIAFRLELDVLRFHAADDDEGEDNAAYDREWQKVCRCLTAFPPLNSELHFVPLGQVRDWLSSLTHGELGAIVHFDGDEWTDSIEPTELSAKSVLVLPTSTNPEHLKDILPPGGDEKPDQRCWDVFDALAQDGAKYRREVKVTSGSSRLKADMLVYRVTDTDDETAATEPENETEEAEARPQPTQHFAKWKDARIKLSFSHHGIAFELRYFKPERGTGAVLEFLRVHLAAAAEHGKQLAEALAPGDAVLAALLGHIGQQHDIGKENVKWQQKMGNTPAWRENQGYNDTTFIAKPVIKIPGKADGYRHEWGTLWAIRSDTALIVADADTASFLRDLHLHAIAAHHGYFRPSMPDRGFCDKPTAAKQNSLRLEAIERTARLQQQLGCWRLAYLETLIKVADVSASKDAENAATENSR